MDLLEYQAKELFRNIGIPVLPSLRIDRPKDLKGLTIPYPVVLKSQVRIGGRGRVGGVKFVENTIDAIAAAHTIFNLPIMGEYPQALLAEAKYNADQEFYLAVVLNRTIRRPVLLGSQQGGIDVQAAIEQMQHVIVDDQFSPYYARRLAIKMGLQGSLIESVSAIVEKMYQLFVQNDLDLVEINPLGVSAQGELMALDGKVTVNDDALSRHPHLAALDPKAEQKQAAYLHETPVIMESDGHIGIICNGAGLTMATMDMVCQAGGKPASFLNIGGETRWDFCHTTLSQRLDSGLELMMQDKHMRVVLINLISNLVPCNEIAAVITSSLERIKAKPQPTNTKINKLRSTAVAFPQVRLPALVVRLVGNHCEPAQALLEAAQIPMLSSLDDAVMRAVVLAKSSSRHS